MEPAPSNIELPPKPPTPETKPDMHPAAKSPEASYEAKTPQDATARGTLEAIANGTPVAEATRPKTEAVPIPDKEQMAALLKESNELLLELKDMRLLISAVATQAADTPLGNETRIEALRTVRDMPKEGLAPDQATSLTALQEKIRGLNLPEHAAGQSSLIPAITAYNEAHPGQEVPQQVIDQIAAGNRDTASAVATLIQSSPDLAQDIWKQLTGVDGFTGLHPTPENILQLAGLATTAANIAKAKELFGTISNMPPRQKESLISQLGPSFMVGALVLMFFTQIATGEGGGGGH